MPNRFNPSAPGFDTANAHFLAHASSLAYVDPDQGLAEQVEAALGLTNLVFFSKETVTRSTQAFVASDDDKIVVAFRGTEPGSLRDWFTDLNIRPAQTRVGQVHGGFHRALDDVWEEGLFDHVRALGVRPLDLRRDVLAPGVRREIGAGGDRRTLWITGHSLGGALATLAAGRLAFEEDYPFEGVYTFGQPRAGDRDYARAYNVELRPRHFRLVNNNDLVTRIPTRTMGFSHVGSLRYLDVKGQLHEQISWWNEFLDRVRGRIEDFLDVFDGDLVSDGIQDHSISDGYLARLARLLD